MGRPDGFADLAVSIEDLFAEGDRAVARIRWRGIRLDGGIVECETIDIERFEGNQAVEHWGARL